MTNIDFQISYKKMKEAFGVKTFKACDKILDEQYGDILDKVANIEYFGLILWEDGETNYKSHKWGIGIHIKTDDANNYNVIKEAFKDILEKISMEEME